MKLLFFLSSLILAQSALAEYKSYNFKVFFTGREVGTLDITYKKNAEVETFEAKSISLVKIFFTKTNIDFYGITTYHNKVLVESYCRNTVDDRVKNYTKISRLAEKYLIHNEIEKKEEVYEPVKFSVLRLYREEPKGMHTIFSESFGKYCPIEEVSKKVYQISLPNGKKSKYYYNEQGMLIKVENNHALGKISFQRII